MKYIMKFRMYATVSLRGCLRRTHGKGNIERVAKLLSRALLQVSARRYWDRVQPVDHVIRKRVSN